MQGTAGRRWYVISLRPRGAHAPLRRVVRAAGHGFVAVSPWRIDMKHDAATREALHDALDGGLAIFTSPHAVAAAHALAPLPAGLHALAVGAGTAASLRRAGVTRVEHPARMDSEGLLALDALAGVRGRAIGLVTAPAGRDAIEPALRARGARVRRADVYARADIALSPRALARLAAVEAPLAIAASSAQALSRVMEQVDAPLRERLLGARVLAASARIASSAQGLGFGDVVVAAGPRPMQLVAALNDDGT